MDENTLLLDGHTDGIHWNAPSQSEIDDGIRLAEQFLAGNIGAEAALAEVSSIQDR